MHRIRVREQQPLAARLACAGPHGVVLTGPIWRQRRSINHMHSGERLRNLASAVGRAVVDNDNFECYAGLCYERFQARSEASLFIARGHDHRDYGLTRYWI